MARLDPYRDLVPKTSVRRHLGTAWSRVVGAGWIGITLGLASVGASSQVIGRPLWWADDVRWGAVGVLVPVVFVFGSSTAVVIWSLFRRRWVPQVSIVGGVLLAVSAFADRHASPGGAVVTVALAAAALLIGVGALSGQTPGTPDVVRAASDSIDSI